MNTRQKHELKNITFSLNHLIGLVDSYGATMSRADILARLRTIRKHVYTLAKKQAAKENE